MVYCHRSEAEVAAAKLAPMSISVAVAARHLNVCPQTLYNWMREGLLKSSKVGGRRLIPMAEVRRLLSAEQ